VITKEDQRRIDFAEKLLNSGEMRSYGHNSIEFLRCAVKHGLLSNSAHAMDAFLLHGKLVKDDVLTAKAAEFQIGAVLPGYARMRAIERMSPPELVALRERVAGVIPFGGK
jgi:hypothetical protein